jgi:hypothetical protein
MAVDREHQIDEESFRGGVSFCQMVPGRPRYRPSTIYKKKELIGVISYVTTDSVPVARS